MNPRVSVAAFIAVMVSSSLMVAAVPDSLFPTLADQHTAQRPRRVFQPVDLGLLEAPDRDEWQKPDQIMDTLRIAEGSTVADLGAGSGWFTMHLARRVGPLSLIHISEPTRP